MEKVQHQKIGCFKIGHKVYRGNGRKAMTITELFTWKSGPLANRSYARLGKGGVAYELRMISLAGPNGEG